MVYTTCSEVGPVGLVDELLLELPVTGPLDPEDDDELEPGPADEDDEDEPWPADDEDDEDADEELDDE